jgi:hypothetical protein
MTAMEHFRQAASLLLIAGILLTSVTASMGHEPTVKQFQRERAVALAQNVQTSEPAPRAGARESACRLTIELVVGADPQPVAGLIRVTNLDSGKALSFSDEILRDKNWYSISPRATLLLPQARVKVEAIHGLETELATREMDLTGKESHTLSIPLKPFYSAAAHGLQAGNTHLHLMKLTHAEMDRYLRVVPQADGLDLVFVSLLRRIPDERDYISNTLTEGDLGRLSQAGVLFGNGEEHRHNFGPGGEGFGHVMLLNILKRIEPVSIGPGIMKEGTDGIPLQRGIRTARQDGATVIWCHNTFGHEDIPNWISGLLHAQNIFDGGDHGTYEDTFYRYLNVGMKVPFSTGTDWFIYDFSRVYLPVSGELTSKKWLAELAAGKTYITNGPFLEFTVNGKPIGETLISSIGDDVRIVGRAIGRNDFRQIELIHNGRIIHTVKAQQDENHFAADLNHSLRVDGPGWFALRLPLSAGQNEFGKPLFAHTSPIYLTVNGQRLFRPDVARGLLTEMEASQELIKEKGTFANADERDVVLRVYREATATLQSQLDARGAAAQTGVK